MNVEGGDVCQWRGGDRFIHEDVWTCVWMFGCILLCEFVCLMVVFVMFVLLALLLSET